ncbi:hypothetical protein DL764_006037 [Monosporascus ibericus]|uniref:Cleavage and polyadenylation specificity factor subunit 5 n=1 Tax=Monosporascus ibericus TaxID=155417 RepID=A0A4Q4T981_9PEZI|nr:hypothetical protein DL764_006037 [Monosporascus ibericus]
MQLPTIKRFVFVLGIGLVACLPSGDILDEFPKGYATSSNNKRIPIAESEDSVNWKFLNKDALPDLPSWIDNNDRGLWAPDVFRDDKGHYIMYCAIDANAFDDGNQRWIMWKVDGNALGGATTCTGGKKSSDYKPTPIKIQKVARDGITLQGSPKTILNHNGASDDGLVEGPAMYKIHADQYVLFFRAGVLAQSGGSLSIYGPGHMDIDKGEYVAFHGRTAPGKPEGLEEVHVHWPYQLRTTVADTDTPLTMSTVTGIALQSSHPPTIPLPFNANQPETIRLYPLSNYTFGVKETQPEEDPSVIARLKRLEEHYGAHGMRRTCEGILVCHEHNHPHILMLQIANAFFKLPGDYLRPEDEEVEGFKARLDERLAPVGRLGEGEEAGDWQIGDCLAQWWRPNFETFMYPFIPGHVTRPKECKKLYFIQLPKSKVLSVPKNMKLLAVPLFELYDNTARYGPQLSAIPHLLSRYNFEFVNENGEVVAATPGSGPEGYKPKTKVLAGGDEDMNDVKDENGTS